MMRFLIALALLVVVSATPASKVFYTGLNPTTGANTINSINVDGTAFEQVLSLTTTDGVPASFAFISVVLDPEMQRMYWSAGPALFSSFMNGTDVLKLRDVPGIIHHGLDLDTRQTQRKLYFTDIATRTISRADLIGFDDATYTQEVSVRPGQPYYVAVAPNGDLFWSERVSYPLTYIYHKHTGGISTVSASFGAPNAIAIDTWNTPSMLYWGSADGGRVNRVEVYGPSPTPSPNAVSPTGANGGLTLDTPNDRLVYISMDTAAQSGVVYSSKLDGSDHTTVRSETSIIPIGIALNGVTPSSSPTPSATSTPSHTASPTPTHTPTSSFNTSSTATTSATHTPSATPSRSGTPSATPSATATYTPSHTASVSFSSSLSPTPSPSSGALPSFVSIALLAVSFLVVLFVLADPALM